MEAAPEIDARLFYRVGLVHKPTAQPADLVVELGVDIKRDLQRNAHCWPLIANAVAAERALSMLGKDYALSATTPERLRQTGRKFTETPLCP